ncbi:arylsulfatase [Luteolibacter flavescens]|uniref:Arylsulfatase n=1 Tax=Luteolibacter flavescens TaxID=1859460 RepID=A0ABT3FJZ1_9BACT|nr:arylsulfatase [Luteolibacter flavescens]MCW1883872.1 arylsulfatase [Luteolibacter flavescens]
MRPGLLIAAAFACTLPASALNVVFIIADDLGYGELGSFGQEKIHTPNLDRLAKEGTRLTRHYSGAPVCAPARCTLMTGKHLGHAEIRGNRPAKVSFPEFSEGQHPISADAVTIASVFRKAGYATGAIGKWGLGPAGSTGDPNKHGFDLFYGYNCQSIAHSYYPRFLWRNDKQEEINPTPIPGHAKQPEGDVTAGKWIGQAYAPDLMVKETREFIASHKAKPFFLYLAFIEPHVAMHPPQDRLDEYPAEWDREPYRSEKGYLPHPRPRAAYATMISDLDRHVGAVREALEQAGVLDETLIVFTSDNGATHDAGGADTEFFRSVGGLRGRKGSLYEGGLRVPTIVRLPGKVKADAEDLTPGYFPDWFPTLCSAAGLKAPGDLDGIDLWPTLTGDAPVKRTKPMLWVFPEYGGQVAVRLGDHKVIRRDLHTKKPGPWQVFDLAADPAESKDIAASQPGLIKEAIDVLKRETSPNGIFPVKVPVD